MLTFSFACCILNFTLGYSLVSMGVLGILSHFHLTYGQRYHLPRPKSKQAVKNQCFRRKVKVNTGFAAATLLVTHNSSSHQADFNL